MINTTPYSSGTSKEEIFNTFLRTLNEAYEADPTAIHALLCSRTPCNNILADHPSIVVSTEMVATTDYYSIGFLGIVNGICEPLTGKRVAAKYKEVDSVTKRHRLVGFTEFVPPIDSPSST